LQIKCVVAETRKTGASYRLTLRVTGDAEHSVKWLVQRTHGYMLLETVDPEIIAEIGSLRAGDECTVDIARMRVVDQAEHRAARPT
jgi:hypothetical protein